MTVKNDNIAVFIDGANLYATAKQLGFDVDYKKLPNIFDDMGNVLRLFYFSAVKADEDYSSIRPMLDWLDYNGYIVVQKPVKTFFDPDTGRTKIKGNMDIEIAVKMFELAPRCDHMVLFTGDGDFRILVESIQRMGCHVTVVSTVETKPPMIADELRRQCDTFLDLKELQKMISRDPAARHIRSAR